MLSTILYGETNQRIHNSARTTPMPSLQELTDLFDNLPEAPLPTPRQRRPPTDATNNTPAIPPTRETPAGIASSPLAEQSFVRRMFPWLFFATPPVPPVPARRPNPFMALKSGKKIVIVAAVDSGNTSFFRFGQGEFTEWPMVWCTFFLDLLYYAVYYFMIRAQDSRKVWKVNIVSYWFLFIPTQSHHGTGIQANLSV